MIDEKDNSGYKNSGNHNSGNHNSGNLNSGNLNSGNLNSGNLNSGNLNSGNLNSGSLNSGNWNSGNYNSGNHNSGNYNSGYLNTNRPPVRIFNKETYLSLDKISFPDFFFFNLTEWISEKNMSDQEKKDNPKYKTIGGYLKVYGYKEAFKKSWDKAPKEDRDKLFKLPNFDADIFLEISGIDVRNYKKDISPDEIIILNNKKYKLIEE